MFSPEEMKAIPPSAHVKILDYQAEVWGCFDIYQNATKEWELWSKNIFSADKDRLKKEKENSSKSWYQLWR